VPAAHAVVTVVRVVAASDVGHATMYGTTARLAVPQRRLNTQRRGRTQRRVRPQEVAGKA